MIWLKNKVQWTLHLSGSANRSDFSRIMQLEVVDSHNALPLTCILLLRLFRFDFFVLFFGLSLFVGVSQCVVYYRLPLLYCSTKNHPALLCARTIAYLSSPRFSIFLATSANHHFMLRFASSAAKNLESLPSLVLVNFA